YYNVGIAEAREIRKDLRWPDTEEVSVFHGRDIFAYAAALLASGQLSFEQIGERYEDIVLFDERYLRAEISQEQCTGIVTNVSDHFGSIVLSIDVRQFLQAGYRYGDQLEVTLENEKGVYFRKIVPYVHTFGDVGTGECLLFNSSSGCLSLGINQGSFRDEFSVSSGLDQKVTLKRE
ncbi:MAG: SAM-dependent chlorinase/fluorinase, partial [Erysipelotrichaceae bacterium]|nr:SAM-dependent chlorinase/fluorinase [Erysipelotrichaceae bacterium]